MEAIRIILISSELLHYGTAAAIDIVDSNGNYFVLGAIVKFASSHFNFLVFQLMHNYS